MSLVNADQVVVEQVPATVHSENAEQMVLEQVPATVQSEHFEYGGQWSPGFESVKDLFLSNFAKGGQERCAQFCAYVKGVKVVDLWAARVKEWQAADGKVRKSKWGVSPGSYGADSIQNVFSSSKVLSSLVIAMLVDRGRLRYDQRIADVWPEYASYGKEEATIRHLMMHEAGLPAFHQAMHAESLSSQGLMSNTIGNMIANEKAAFVPGSKRVYHANTRDIIANEIVRRVDVKRRTIGQFLLDEVATPLGVSEELRIGVPEELLHKIAPLVIRPSSWFYKNALLPKAFGGGRIPDGSNAKGRAVAFTIYTFVRFGPSKKLNLLPKPEDKNKGGLKHAISVFNSNEIRKVELPSSNAHCSARALAAVANAIVKDDNEVILTKKGKALAHGDPDKKFMITADLTFSNAGWCLFEELRDGYVGWMGLGGSACQWHHEEQIAIGYAMDSIEVLLYNARAKNLQTEVLKCVKKLKVKTA